MLVSIIIINYNTFKLTCDCVESVIKYTKEVGYEIILVDNNSTECDADLFSERFPNLTLIKNKVNAGFAKGNNLGIQHSKGNIILLLNSDTYLLEDSISKTAVKLTQQKRVGVIGIKMIFAGGRLQHTARRFRTIKWELLDLFRFMLFFVPYKKRAKLMLGRYFNGDFMTDCDWLNGAFFMFPKKILQQLPDNKLDERFFMYGEDHLWCYQIKQAGFGCLFYPETSVVHINNGSTNKARQLTLTKIMMRNELEIMRYSYGTGLYYYTLRTLYLCKENCRYIIKWIILKSFGKQL